MLEVCFFLSEQTPEPPGAAEEEAGCGPEAEIQRGGENHGAEGKSRPHLARRGILRVIPFHTYLFPASLSPTFHPPKKNNQPSATEDAEMSSLGACLGPEAGEGDEQRSFFPPLPRGFELSGRRCGPFAAIVGISWAGSCFPAELELN